MSKLFITVSIAFLGCTLRTQALFSTRSLDRRLSARPGPGPEDAQCAQSQRLTFQSVLFSNLGGLGPNFNAPEGILYGDVLPGSSDTVDLLVQTVSERRDHGWLFSPTYFPNSTAANGVRGKRQALNIEAGSTINLNFTFINRERQARQEVGPFLLSFLDLKYQDQVAVPDSVAYALSSETDIFSAVMPWGWQVFGPRRDSEPEADVDDSVDSMLIMDRRLNKAVTFTLPSLSSFDVLIGNVEQVNEGRTFLLDGPTTLACPAVQSCDNIFCPSGFIMKPDAQKLTCDSFPCDLSDVPRCCDMVPDDTCKRSRHLRFTPGSVLRSNLGGRGPNFGPTQDMVIGDVFPVDYRREPIDAVITATSPYSPGPIGSNQVSRRMWTELTFAQGQEVGVTITFERSGSPYAVDPFFMTAQLVSSSGLDGDSGLGANLTVMDVTQYNLTSNSVLEGRPLGTNDVVVAFPAYSATPSDALFRLSPEAGAGSASFKFPRTQAVTFQVSVPPSSEQQFWTLRLGGASSIVCPRKSTCSSFICPRMYVHKVNNGNIECNGDTCTDDDIDTCCALAGDVGCKDTHSFQILPNSLLYSNLGGQGPDLHEPRGLAFGNVFPGSGRILDLEITDYNDQRYETFYPDSNGIQGAWGSVSVKAGMTTVLALTLYDRATGERAAAPAPWYFSFITVSTSEGLEARTLISQVEPTTARHAVDARGHVSVNNGMFVFPSMPHGDLPAHPRALTGNEESRATTLLFPAQPERGDSFLMAVSGSDAANSTFMFSGPSTLVCPARALCSSYVCPSFYAANPEAANQACQSMPCGIEDTSLCCVGQQEEVCTEERQLVFKNSNVLYSNLGGSGPDYDSPEALVIQDVFPKSGHTIDLAIVAVGEYMPAKQGLERVVGGMLSLNGLTGSNNTFRFTLMARGGREFEMWPYALAFFDFDMQKNGGGAESVVLPEPLSMSSTPMSHVDISSVPGELLHEGFMGPAVRLAATVPATGTGNPSNALALTPEQLNFSAAMVMGPKTDFYVRFGITPGFNSGRNMMMAGASNLLCPSHALCTDYTCPMGFEDVENKGMQVCSGPTCSDSDKDVCCVRTVEPGCTDAEGLYFEGIVYSNLGNQGPDFDRPEGIVFSNVLPGRSAGPVDLNITSLSNYSGTDSSLNSCFNGYARIAIKAGTAVMLKFEFIDRATGLPVVLSPTLLTLVALSTDASGGAAQSATVYGNFLGHNLTATHSLRPEDCKEGCGSCSNTYTAGGYVEHRMPDALSLPQGMLDTSISFTINGTANVSMLFASTVGTSANFSTFFISGRSNIVCPGKAVCSSFSCPAGMSLKEDPGLYSCAGETCQPSDVSTCCLWRIADGCDESNALVFSEESVIRPPHADDGDTHVLLGNVFPHSGRVVDMAVAINNGPDLNVESGEGHVYLQDAGPVKLHATFIDRALGSPVEMGPFLFSFLDMLQDDAGQVKVAYVDQVAMTKTRARGGVRARSDNVLVGRRLNLTDTENVTQPNTPEVPDNLLNLSMERLARVGTVLIPRTSEFKFNLSLECWRPQCEEASTRAKLFRFAGRTNLVCPQRDSCEEYECPDSFMLRPHPKTRQCEGRRCRSKDVHTCCVKVDQSPACAVESRLSLRVDSVIHSNLGGHGPNTSFPPSVLYGDVFPELCGAPVDMEITADDQYGTVKPEKNGVAGSWGSINVATGSTANLQVSFINRRTGRPKVVGPMYFTILDLDEQKDGRGKEAIQMLSPVLEAKTTPDSEVMEDGTKFSSSLWGSGDDNVMGVNALALAPSQLSRSVSYLLPPTSAFNVTFSSSPGWAGRNMFFAGASDMVCYTHAVCSSYVCPYGMLPKSGGNDLVCAESVCTDSDRGTCCQEVVQPGCDASNAIQLNPGSLVFSNLGGFGPDNSSPEGMLFGDVFPRSADSLDLMLDVVGAYSPVDPRDNAMDSMYGTFTVGCNSSVEMRFRFINRRTGSPQALDHPWYVTFFDFTRHEEDQTTPEIEVDPSAGAIITTGSDVFAKGVLDGQGFSRTSTLKHTRKFKAVRGMRASKANETRVPLHPMLKSEHEAAVAILFPAGQTSHSVHVRNWITQEAGSCPGRKMFWAGASGLVCPGRQSCRDYVCPAGYQEKQSTGGLMCQGFFCSAADNPTCCEATTTTTTTPAAPCQVPDQGAAGLSVNPPGVA